jgi:N-acetyl-anhydromuramyl-L-alanine amidase AmpD
MRAPRRSKLAGVVIHYTGGGNGRALARWLAGPDARVSAHLLNCRDGHVIQQVAFENEAWHAGEKNSMGFWKGEPQPENVNRFTIGIENSNYGWLIKGIDGKFYVKRRAADGGWRAGRRYRGPHPIMAKDHTGVDRYWEPYTDAVVAANVEELKLIVDQNPDITRLDVGGHSDVSPHRKFDPGPLFPWSYVLDEVFGSGSNTGQAGNVLLGGAEVSGDTSVEPREYYDEELGMCVLPDGDL